MIPQAIAAVGAAAVGKHAYDKYTTSTHDWHLRKACKTAQKVTNDTASVYVDHVDDDVTADGNCAGVLDAEYIPDLIVQDFAGPSLVVEVETAQSLSDEPAHAAAQLSAFATPGYTRVLVCDDVEQGEQFVNNYELDGVRVAEATDVDRFL